MWIVKEPCSPLTGRQESCRPVASAPDNNSSLLSPFIWGRAHQDMDCNWLQCASSAWLILSYNKLWYQPVLHFSVLQSNSISFFFFVSFSWLIYRQSLSLPFIPQNKYQTLQGYAQEVQRGRPPFESLMSWKLKKKNTILKQVCISKL